MKRLMKLLFLFVGILAIPFAGYCVEMTPLLVADTAQQIPSTNWGEYFSSIATLAPLVILLTEWLKNNIKVAGGVMQLFSWLISIILCFFGWGFNLGMFAELEWYQVVLSAVAIGLVANGIFDIKVAQAILDVLSKKLKVIFSRLKKDN